VVSGEGPLILTAEGTARVPAATSCGEAWSRTTVAA
jgi:hypothetical protein